MIIWITFNCRSIVGKQGIGKSTLVNSLIPIELKAYLQEQGDFTEAGKDSKITLATHLLVNIDELESFNKKDVDSLKSLITTKNFDVRMPYDQYSQKLTKRASFCGSTNTANFLRDTTGNRRFLIFEIESIDFKAIDNELVKNMYWQARELFKAGFKCYLSLEDIEQLNSRNERFSQEDWVKDILIKHLKPSPVFEESNSIALMTTTEIAQYLMAEENIGNYNIGQLVKKLGAYLKKYDFLRRTVRVNGKVIYKYAVIKENTSVFTNTESCVDF